MHLHIRPLRLHVSAFTPWVWLSAGSVGHFNVSLGKASGLTAAIHVGSGSFLNYRLGCDWEERIVWQRGPFMLTRLETEQEEADRIDAEAEAAFMEHERNRYVEWSY